MFYVQTETKDEYGNSDGAGLAYHFKTRKQCIKKIIELVEIDTDLTKEDVANIEKTGMYDCDEYTLFIMESTQ